MDGCADAQVQMQQIFMGELLVFVVKAHVGNPSNPYETLQELASAAICQLLPVFLQAVENIKQGLNPA